MLTRIILTGIVIALVIMVYRRLQHAKRPKAPPATTAPPMKKCAQCGVHLPETDAIQVGDHFYCSEQHRLQHQQDSNQQDPNRHE